MKKNKKYFHIIFIIFLCSLWSAVNAHAASGDLDSSFGNNGRANYVFDFIYQDPFGGHSPTHDPMGPLESVLTDGADGAFLAGTSYEEPEFIYVGHILEDGRRDPRFYLADYYRQIGYDEILGLPPHTDLSAVVSDKSHLGPLLQNATNTASIDITGVFGLTDAEQFSRVRYNTTSHSFTASKVQIQIRHNGNPITLEAVSLDRALATSNGGQLYLGSVQSHGTSLYLADTRQILLKLTPAGGLDLGFGNDYNADGQPDGFLLLDNVLSQAYPSVIAVHTSDMAILANGKIRLIAAVAASPTVVLYQLNANGSLDNAYGPTVVGGVQRPSVSWQAPYTVDPTQLRFKETSDNRWILFGASKKPAIQDDPNLLGAIDTVFEFQQFFLGALNAPGTLDTSYGNNGFTTFVPPHLAEDIDNLVDLSNIWIDRAGNFIAMASLNLRYSVNLTGHIMVVATSPSGVPKNIGLFQQGLLFHNFNLQGGRDIIADSLMDSEDRLLAFASDENEEGMTHVLRIIIEDCGNSELEGQEACDDGNTQNNDGCSSLCIVEFCGDNIVNFNPATQTVENCDDGNTVDGDGCSATCRIEGCGDGLINIDFATRILDACDDGNTNSNDGCSAACRVESCGDRVVNFDVALNSLDECDDGGRANNDGCSSTCRIERCGDGLVNMDNISRVLDQCDDGNVNDDDGCSHSCQRELCGDGEVNFDFRTRVMDECDDGGRVSGDGCSSLCKSEDACDGLDNDGDGLFDEDQGGDTDNDHRGNACDNCPTVINPNQLNADGDNLGDACDVEECDHRDNDGDGLVDEDPLSDRGAPDADGDGWSNFCDREICNGVDDNGYLGVDEDFPDTDGDGVKDCVDICAAGDDHLDADGDRVPDHCDLEICNGIDDNGLLGVDEGFPDTDGDGVKNCLDICVNGNDTRDADMDGIPNKCDLEKCNGVDDNGDGQADEDFPDTDGDGVKDCLDICAGGDDYKDADGDKIPNKCDPETCNGIDDNGVRGSDEGFADTDGDGVKDCLDICVDGDDTQDADGDGIPNKCDLEKCNGADDNGDGRADEGFPDTDRDGVKDCLDLCEGGDDKKDADKDGVPNRCDLESCNGLDDNGDGNADEGFNDADNDGVKDCLDICVSGDDTKDADGDGIPNKCDVEKCNGLDDNGDGQTDELFDNADGDALGDQCDNCPKDKNDLQKDTDGDGLGDACDPRPVCGNGVVEGEDLGAKSTAADDIAAEECDDGNMLTGDGCDQCQFECDVVGKIEDCTDKELKPEQCEITQRICQDNHTWSACSIRPAVEGSACSGDDKCQEYACNAASECVGSAIAIPASDNECETVSCDPATGIVSTPVADGTSCGASDSCTTFACTSGECAGTAVEDVNDADTIPECLEQCGDGVKQDVEECDDGNKANDDGCSTVCKFEVLPAIETESACSDAGGVWVPTISQIIDQGEENEADNSVVLETDASAGICRRASLNFTGAGCAASIAAPQMPGSISWGFMMLVFLTIAPSMLLRARVKS